MFLDNMKQNKKGEIWVAGPSIREPLTYYLDHYPALRTFLIKFPDSLLETARNKSLFGGLKVTFNNPS